MARRNPYAMDPALARGVSNLTKALLGSASDDAAMARGRYYDAQAAGQRQTNEFERKRNDGIDAATVPGGFLANQILGNFNATQDDNGNYIKQIAPGQPQMSVPALPGQVNMSKESLDAQMQGLARAFFGDGKYNPDQFSKGLGNIAENAVSSLARAMVMDPATTEEGLRRAAMVLNQNQVTSERNQDVRARTTERGQDVRAGTTERGQDMTADTARRGQDIRSTDTQRGQDIRSSDTQRGQDISAQTAQRGQDIRSTDTQRGQDIRSTDTQRGQDIRSTDTQRGQDIRSSDTQRGQDVRSSDTQRGQDIRSTDTQRGQDIRSTDTQRGQDIRSTDTQRGQDIRSTDTQRGQDISADTAKRGQDVKAQTAKEKDQKKTQKRPTSAQVDKKYGESVAAVEGANLIPNAARAAIKGQLLRFVDRGLNENKNTSYDVVWNTYVDNILAAGVTEISTGYGDGLSDFGVPSFFYKNWAQKDASGRPKNDRNKIISYAKGLKYSDKQADAIANQILK